MSRNLLACHIVSIIIPSNLQSKCHVANLWLKMFKPAFFGFQSAQCAVLGLSLGLSLNQRAPSYYIEVESVNRRKSLKNSA